MRETLRALLLRKATCLFLIYWKFPLNEKRSERKYVHSILHHLMAGILHS